MGFVWLAPGGKGPAQPSLFSVCTGQAGKASEVVTPGARLRTSIQLSVHSFIHPSTHSFPCGPAAFQAPSWALGLPE